MKVSSPDLPPSEHEPSAPPDERALFSRLAASMARHRRAVIITWLVVAFAAAPLALTLSSALSGAGWEAQGSIAQDGARRAPAATSGRWARRTRSSCTTRRTPITDDPSGLQALVAKLQHAPRATGSRRSVVGASGDGSDLA